MPGEAGEDIQNRLEAQVLRFLLKGATRLSFDKFIVTEAEMEIGEAFDVLREAQAKCDLALETFSNNPEYKRFSEAVDVIESSFNGLLTGVNNLYEIIREAK